MDPLDKSNSVAKMIKIQLINKYIQIRFFIYRQIRYIWNGKLFCSSVFQINLPFEEIHSKYSEGLTEKSFKEQFELYGENLMKVPIKSYLFLILNELTNPFYVFQIIGTTFWIIGIQYYWYKTIFCKIISKMK